MTLLRSALVPSRTRPFGVHWSSPVTTRRIQGVGLGAFDTLVSLSVSKVRHSTRQSLEPAPPVLHPSPVAVQGSSRPEAGRRGQSRAPWTVLLGGSAIVYCLR